jgi:hypothetical protein
LRERINVPETPSSLKLRRSGITVTPDATRHTRKSACCCSITNQSATGYATIPPASAAVALSDSPVFYSNNSRCHTPSPSSLTRN